MKYDIGLETEIASAQCVRVCVWVCVCVRACVWGEGAYVLYASVCAYSYVCVCIWMDVYLCMMVQMSINHNE